MKCIVGLGNPGGKYAKTRHNVGFMVVDSLIQSLKIKTQSEKLIFTFSKKFKAEIAQFGEMILVKPFTFMNESGKTIAVISNFYKINVENIYVIHDDLDIKLGEYKLQFGVGPRVHYGVNSIEKSLGTSGFWRMRVGVENRTIRGNRGIPGEKYSLGNFLPEEREIIEKVVEEVVAELMSVVF